MKTTFALLPAWTAVLASTAMFAATALAAPPPAPAGTPPARGAGSASTDTVGTTVIGEDDSPIGLVIAPWKEDYARAGVARPQRLLQEVPVPIDPDVFHRQNEYYDTITAFRAAEREGKPAADQP